MPIYTGNSTVNTAFSAATTVFAGNVHVGNTSSNPSRGLISVVAPAGNTCGISFADATNNSRGRLWWSTVTGSVGVSLFNDDNSNLMLGTTGATRLNINSSGHVTMTAQPAFRVQRSSTFTGSTSGYSEVIFDNTHFNVGGHYSTSTGRFTAPVTGRYHFDFFAVTHNVTEYLYGTISVNGSTASDSKNAWYHLPVTDGEYRTVHCSSLVQLSAGDYVSVTMRGNNGSPQIEAARNGFMGYLVN